MKNCKYCSVLERDERDEIDKEKIPYLASGIAEEMEWYTTYEDGYYEDDYRINSIFVGVYIDNDILKLSQEEDFNSIRTISEIKINFCPICGRKL